MKKKSFYFEDYTESYLIDKKNKLNIIKVSLNRVTFLSFIFLSLILIFSIKVIYLSLSTESNFNNNIKRKLHKGNFFSIGKRLTPKEKDQLWLMGNKAFVFDPKPSRIYPQKNLFSHILGQTDDVNSGISGVEKFFDKDLNDEKKINSPIKLTLDSNLQYLIRQELIKAQSIFQNIGSGAILMDVENGEVLSLVSLPDYDLNKRALINDSAYTNKITLGVYELGSVFKTFTIAAGLESGIIKSDTLLKNLEDSLKCDKYTIKEHDELPKNLTVEEVLIRSSNIGSVRIAQKIGVKKYSDFLNSLELLNTPDFDLEEIGTPLSFKWGKCKLATTSYGHGITTTPLQVANAYAVLGNGGYKIKPTILKKTNQYENKRQKVVSKKTSDEINSMLRKVVNLDEGTANFANIEGYEVGGKTGTALKYNSKAKLNTFVSLFPSTNPKYVLLVMLDEPKPAPNFVYEFPSSKKFPNGYKYKGERRNTSGWNTVVVAGKIIEKIGPILAIKNLQASTNF